MAGNDVELERAHLDWLRFRNLAPSTIQQRRYAIGRLERYVGEPTAWLRVEPIFDYLASLDGAGHRACELKHLRQWYRWLQSCGHRLDDPTVSIPVPQVPKRLPRPISEADIGMAYSLSEGRIRAWILLGGWAGLRCCEIAGLRAEHLTERVVLIARAKGGDAEAAPCSTWLTDELGRCGLPLGGWLFPRGGGASGPIPAHRVSQIGSAFFHSLGLPYTMHQLRHRFGTQALIAAGGDIRVAQELLRHKSLVSTQGYTYVAPTRGLAVVEQLPTPHDQPRLFDVA